MSSHDIASTEVKSAIFVDEIGIALGIYGDFRLKTAYRPIFALSGETLQPVAVEGLVKPYLNGAAFPPARQFGEAEPGDALLMEAVCRALHLRNHENIGVDGLDLFVNCDALAKNDAMGARRAVRQMANVIQEMWLDPAKVICEFSEGAADTAILMHIAGEMRRHGLRIAVSDCGAGHSGEQLAPVRPDFVRVDGAWFRAMAAKPETARLFAPVVAGFHALDAQVLVEGIESADQLEVALGGGADLVEGDFLAHPTLAGAIFPEDPIPLAASSKTDEKTTSLFG